jgi:fructokinase
MASGPAIADRAGLPAESLAGAVRDRAVELEAYYLAQALRTIVYVTAPERIVVGGGVAAMPGLVDCIRRRLSEELADYPVLPEHLDERFVAPATLGSMAGPLGASILGQLAADAVTDTGHAPLSTAAAASKER